MRPLSMDSRMLLLVILTDGVEAGARGLFQLWKQGRPAARLQQQLRLFESAGWVAADRDIAPDVRLVQATKAGVREAIGGVDADELWARPWDGVWRMVMFDVPQAQARLRSQFRRKLRTLRFGWLQNSVWLSPDPVDELARELRQHKVDAESLLMVDARPSAGESDENLVAAAWDFPRLAKLHASYHKILRLRPGTKGTVRFNDWSEWLQTEERAWAEILRVDPFLPERLLPADYQGREVWTARREGLTAAAHGIAQAMSRSS